MTLQVPCLNGQDLILEDPVVLIYLGQMGSPIYKAVGSPLLSSFQDSRDILHLGKEIFISVSQRFISVLKKIISVVKFVISVLVLLGRSSRFCS